MQRGGERWSVPQAQELIKIIDAGAGGKFHSAVITEDGKSYTFGSNAAVRVPSSPFHHSCNHTHHCDAPAIV